jgi:hypothetical protein
MVGGSDPSNLQVALLPATRIGAKRRELFARETFARSASVFNRQLWLSVSREVPTDFVVMTSLIGGFVVGLSGRLTTAQTLSMTGVVVLLAASSLSDSGCLRSLTY